MQFLMICLENNMSMQFDWQQLAVSWIPAFPTELVKQNIDRE